MSRPYQPLMAWSRKVFTSPETPGTCWSSHSRMFSSSICLAPAVTVP